MITYSYLCKKKIRMKKIFIILTCVTSAILCCFAQKAHKPKSYRATSESHEIYRNATITTFSVADSIFVAIHRDWADYRINPISVVTFCNTVPHLGVFDNTERCHVEYSAQHMNVVFENEQLLPIKLILTK